VLESGANRSAPRAQRLGPTTAARLECSQHAGWAASKAAILVVAGDDGGGVTAAFWRTVEQCFRGQVRCSLWSCESPRAGRRSVPNFEPCDF